MSWFRYLPITANPSSSNQDENYVYPVVRRKIQIPSPDQTIPINSWIFVDVKDLKIDDFIDNSLVNQTEQNSYLVVYESFYNEAFEFIPVESHIVNNRLFFKTAEVHNKGVNILKQYSLYYKTNDIKVIKKVENGEFEDYISCDPVDAEFVTSVNDVDETFFDVFPSTNETYSFSFTNLGVDWNNGVSLVPGAKAVGTFTGPFFELYCQKGPDLGQFEIRFISLGSQESPTPIVEQDWFVIDLFSPERLENQLVYSKNNFYYNNYIFEIISNFEKNNLSSNGKIKIDHYSYGYDAHCKIGSEQISPYLLRRRILGGSVNG